MPKKRCGWVGEGNSLMLEYHDLERAYRFTVTTNISNF